jgi:hypothetical protein
MNEPERWLELERFYHMALERPAEERAPFVEHECAHDEWLRRELESLLTHEHEDEDFLDMLSIKRDRAAAQRFFQKAKVVAGQSPEQVTTDGHNSYPRATAEVLGQRVKHRGSRYKNNRIEQDHRGIKQRYYPMLGFQSFQSAQKFCHSFDELRNYFRPRHRCYQVVSAVRRREQFRTNVDALQSTFLARS